MGAATKYATVVVADSCIYCRSAAKLEAVAVPRVVRKNHVLKLEDLDLDMIAMAMQDDGSMGTSYVLDTETGEVIMYGFDSNSNDEIDLEDEKYISIDRIESYESYQHMEDFTAALPAGGSREQLEQALIRSKPFRHFKDALNDFPETQKDWHKFKDDAMAKVIVRWLVDEKIIENPEERGFNTGSAQ